MSDSKNIDLKSEIFANCIGCVYGFRDKDCPFSEITLKKTNKEIFDYIDKLCFHGLIELQKLHLECKMRRKNLMDR